MTAIRRRRDYQAALGGGWARDRQVCGRRRSPRRAGQMVGLLDSRCVDDVDTLIASVVLHVQNLFWPRLVLAEMRGCCSAED